jgi:hypothetical protein
VQDDGARDTYSALMRCSLLTSLLLAIACTAPAQTPFAAATTAEANLDLASARKLYRQAAQSDPDPKQRAQATLHLANIEWRVDHDLAAAEKDLELVPADSELIAVAWAERARLNAEVRGDFDAARTAAGRAISLAKTDLERLRATTVLAEAIVELVARARFAGRCEGDAASFATPVSELKAIMEKAGPMPPSPRLLLDVALLANDGPAALAGWRAYYGTIADSALLAPAAATLAEKLPSWRGADAPADDRRAVGLALADSRFFDEAALVLSDPCAKQRPDDRRSAEIVAYGAALRDLRVKTEEYYRNVALRRAKPDDLRRIVDAGGRALWPRLAWDSAPPEYSQERIQAEISRRFGAYAGIGTTSNIFDLHYGHRVIDETRQVSQYGHTASLHFVALDGMISDGFMLWYHDGRGGDGGWANEQGIFQVRPLYVPGPLRAWADLTQPEQRERHRKDLEREAKLDEERLARDPNQIPTGVAMRLEDQYREALLAALQKKGLQGDALRDGFVAQMTRDVFDSSIWAHEGRHAIDKSLDSGMRAPELEFRAKLSEVVLAPAPRKALESIAATVPASSPHGQADRRIGEALAQWMRAHAEEIAALDRARPMLLQVDKLTDDQLRVSFRSIDPLAKAASTRATSSGLSTPRWGLAVLMTRMRSPF